MVIGTINDIDFNKVLNCIVQRKYSIQPYLLGEIMKQMVIYASCEYVPKYVNFVIKQYKLLNKNEMEQIYEHYNEFINKFEVR